VVHQQQVNKNNKVNMSFLQTQIQIPNMPINKVISGYNNEINTSVAVIAGSNNKVNTPNTHLVGNNNYVLGPNGLNMVIGSNNSSTGTDNTTIGSYNLTNGNKVVIQGDANNVKGQYIYISGSQNNTGSPYKIQSTNNISVFGDGNTLTGQYVIVNGSKNIVQEGTGYIYIIGDSNTTQGGMIFQDISGLTNSGPTVSVDPYMVGSQNVFIQGNENVVATYSSNVSLFGSGQFVDTSDQFIIGDDKDVNIKSAVLPCNLIQTYTPTGSTDSTYPVGAITKDNEQAYVNTDIGWQELPFRSYGTYYDTTTQTNPTASQVNKMKFNTNGDGANGVGITNSNDVITFQYSGMYNIAFSAQIYKTGGGDSYIDIWLRKNNTDVSWSNTTTLISKQQDKAVLSWNWLYYFNAGDTANICWSSADTGISLLAQGTQSTPTRPAIPSTILTVWKV